MSAIRGHDTTPERLVRSVLHRHGLRFRLHVRDLRAAGWRVIVVWECELGVARGTAMQRAARLERLGRSLVRKVTGPSSGR